VLIPAGENTLASLCRGLRVFPRFRDKGGKQSKLIGGLALSPRPAERDQPIERSSKLMEKKALKNLP
jgi:hypothetical protein